MLNPFKRAIRSRERDDETDTKRFERMLAVLKEVSNETEREYDGLVKRMRELNSREVNETVYAVRKPSEAELESSREDVSKQLAYAVVRTERLLEQMKSQRALIEAVQRARSSGTL